MDYQTQQMQLFPLLASAYVLYQLGYYIMQQYKRMETEIYTKGNFDGMQEVSINAKYNGPSQWNKCIVRVYYRASSLKFYLNQYLCVKAFLKV